jgi:hypothetical protein
MSDLSYSTVETLESYKVSLGYYNQLKRENEYLSTTLSTNENSLLTNNRKSFYENQITSSYSSWQQLFFFVYSFFLVIYIWLRFFVDIDKSFVYSVLKCLVLCIFPFLTHFLSELLLSGFLYVAKQPYMNPYFNIESINPYLKEYIP